MSNIGIDFDDVLVATGLRVLNDYNDLYGTSLTLDDWYDLTPEALIRYGATEVNEVVKRVMEMQGKDDFSVTPIEGAVEALKVLQQRGHKLMVITGRPESLRTQTLRNVEQYFGDIFTPENLYFVDHFNHDDVVGKRVTKANVASDLALDYFIDDVISHANIVAGIGVRTALLDRGYKWNQGIVDSGVTRLTSWREILEFIDGR